MIEARSAGVPKLIRSRLFWILTAAFLLRIVGLNFGLPFIYHQDEAIVVNHAMAIGVQGWNTHTYLPPQFAAYFLFFVYAAQYLLGSALGIFKSASHFGATFLNDPSWQYILGRLTLGVVFGTATVAVVYRVGRAFFSRPVAEAAAFFLALSLLHVQHSHYIYVDIPLTFACTLFFFYLFKCLENPSSNNALLTGVFLGWSISIKYTAVYFSPAVPLAVFFLAGNGVALQKKITAVLLSSLAAVCVYAVVSPYTFLDWENFRAQVFSQSQSRGYVGPYHHLTYSLLNGTGFSFLVLVFFGSVIGFFKSAKTTFLVVFTLLIYYWVNVYFSQPFARYMMPLLPLLCLLAGVGLVAVLGQVRSKFLKILFVTAVAAELLVPSIYSDWLLTRQDTRTEALAWVEKNIPVGSVIAIDNRFFAPPLAQTRAQIEDKMRYLEGDPNQKSKRTRLELLLKSETLKKSYEIHTLKPAGEEDGPDFLFARPFVRADWPSLEKIGTQYLIFNYAQAPAALHEFKDSIAGRLKLLTVFSPYHDPAKKKMTDEFGSTAAPHALEELFSRRRLGPYLEIYGFEPSR